MSGYSVRRDHSDTSMSYTHTSSTSPHALRTSHSSSSLSPLNKYRDSVGGEIPIYRTSCADCHSHVKEMIRIHELWQMTKKDLLHARRSHESLLKEYKEEVERTAQQHARILNGFQDELEQLRAETRGKSEQIMNLRAEIVALNANNTELNHQLTSTHEKYAEQVSQNSVMSIRVRELENSLQSLRFEKDTLYDANVSSLRDDVRATETENEQLRFQVQSKDREVRSLIEQLDSQRNEITRTKSVEKKQNEVLERQSEEKNKLTLSIRNHAQTIEELNDDRSRLNQKVHEQTVLIEEQDLTIASLRAQVRDLKLNEEAIENQALGEFRRSRRQIEHRLEKLQSECAQVVTLLSPTKYGGEDHSERLPDWLPPAVAALVKQFRNTMLEGGKNVSNEMSSFLIALNRIWRERLDEKIRQLRLVHAADIRELKRRLAQRIPYEQVVQKARILRLQRSLDDTRAVTLKTKTEKAKGLLDVSLQTVENLSRQVVEYEKENQLLKNQLQILIDDKACSTTRLSDSAQWIATQTISAINTLGDKLWSSANSFMDTAKKLSKHPDAYNKLNTECQLFLDALELDCRACKSSVKRALAEADGPEWEQGAQLALADKQ